jgi:hypothetical protein
VALGVNGLIAIHAESVPRSRRCGIAAFVDTVDQWHREIA